MVLVLSEKENKIEKEMAEILKNFGKCIVNDSDTLELPSDFTAVFLHSVTKIVAQSGIVIATDNLKNFKNQKLPKNFIGVCAENNKAALKLFKSNNLSVITCGTGRKNTLSVSSIDDGSMLLCLQRSITDAVGNIVEPCEIKVKLNKQRNLFSLLCSVCALIYYRPSAAEESIKI